MVNLNDAYIKVEYRLEREGFDNVPALIRYYVGNRKPVSHVSFFGVYFVFCFNHASIMLNRNSCLVSINFDFIAAVFNWFNSN